MDVTVIADDPALRSVAHHELVSGLGWVSELHLDVDAIRFAPGQQLLLQRLPVGRVVDVAGDVALGGTERPTACFSGAVW